MKQIIVLIVGLAITQQGCAQNVRKDTITPPWKLKAACSANFNQAAFSENWKGGGITSLGLNAQLNARATYKKDRHNWNNELDLLFGFVYRKGAGYQKTLDRVYLDTKYGYALNKHWDLFTSLNLLTQFAKGYDNEEPKNLISEIFAPAYITSAWGVEYHPVDYFNVRIAPLAPRVTIVNNPKRFVEPENPKPYGVNPNYNARFEWLALQILAEFNKDLASNINLQWRYLLYANYETFNFKQLDHRIDLTLTANVWKLIQVSLGGILIYDYDQDESVQLNQLFTLGINYTIKNFKDEKK